MFPPDLLPRHKDHPTDYPIPGLEPTSFREGGRESPNRTSGAGGEPDSRAGRVDSSRLISPSDSRVETLSKSTRRE